MVKLKMGARGEVLSLPLGSLVLNSRDPKPGHQENSKLRTMNAVVFGSNPYIGFVYLTSYVGLHHVCPSASRTVLRNEYLRLLTSCFDLRMASTSQEVVSLRSISLAKNEC